MGVPPCVESRRVNGWESTETEGDGRARRAAGRCRVTSDVYVSRETTGGGVAIDR